MVLILARAQSTHTLRRGPGYKNMFFAMAEVRQVLLDCAVPGAAALEGQLSGAVRTLAGSEKHCSVCPSIGSSLDSLY